MWPLKTAAFVWTIKSRATWLTSVFHGCFQAGTSTAVSKVDDSWATVVASFRVRLLDFRSCWIVFIHVVRGRPGGLLQFSKEEADWSWQLFHLTFTQCDQTMRNAVLGRWLKGVVAQLSISPGRFACGRTTWFLIAFASTNDQRQNNHWSVRLSCLSQFLIIEIISPAHS